MKQKRIERKSSANGILTIVQDEVTSTLDVSMIGNEDFLINAIFELIKLYKDECMRGYKQDE